MRKNHANRTRAPSIGLLDQPGDASFYEWHLVDPKDSPFATFRFHYRSWNSLKQLTLIPPGEVGAAELISSPRSCANQKDIENIGIGSAEPLFNLNPEDQDSFEDETHASDTDERSADDSIRGLSDGRLKLRPLASFISALPQPSKVDRDAFPRSYLQRPLPELPKDEPPAYSRCSSLTSAVSGAPSLTPSLSKYVEDGSFDTDQVEVGVAQVVLLQNGGHMDSELQEAVADISAHNSSTSDYDATFPSTDDSASLDALPSREYSATTGTSLERQLRHYSPQPQANFQLLDAEKTDEANELCETSPDADNGLSESRAIDITESQWMKRTPSPALTRPSSPVPRMWSPRPLRSSKSRNHRAQQITNALLPISRRPQISESSAMEGLSSELWSIEEGVRGNWI